jgi:hypothetical protein
MKGIVSQEDTKEDGKLNSVEDAPLYTVQFLMQKKKKN